MCGGVWQGALTSCAGHGRERPRSPTRQRRMPISAAHNATTALDPAPVVAPLRKRGNHTRERQAGHGTRPWLIRALGARPFQVQHGPKACPKFHLDSLLGFQILRPSLKISTKLSLAPTAPCRLLAHVVLTSGLPAHARPRLPDSHPWR